MATLTIRNLSEETKSQLRKLAARHGHSMEEEVRQILTRAALEPEDQKLASAIVEIFAEIGGVDLDLPPRTPVRTPPDFSEPAP